MSDLEKLDKVQGFVEKWVNWAKQNTMIVGILITGIPAIGAFGYTAITKFNEVKAMYEDFDTVASNASSSKRRVEALEEKIAEMRENQTKLQERSSDALINAREAKLMAESTQKEVRSLARAQETELKAMGESMKTEINSIKRATTNRLGQ